VGVIAVTKISFPSGLSFKVSKNSKFYGLFEKMVKDNTLLLLEIHGLDDGKKIFKRGTRYDFYLIEKIKNYDYFIN
jgi:hypothetical protein